MLWREASIECPSPHESGEKVPKADEGLPELDAEPQSDDRAAARGRVAGDGFVAFVGCVLELHEWGDAVEVDLDVEVDRRVGAIGDGAEREDREDVGTGTGAGDLDVGVDAASAVAEEDRAAVPRPARERFVEPCVRDGAIHRADVLRSAELDALRYRAADVREDEGRIVERDEIAVRAAERGRGDLRAGREGVVVAHFGAAAPLRIQIAVPAEREVQLPDRRRAERRTECRTEFVRSGDQRRGKTRRDLAAERVEVVVTRAGAHFEAIASSRV